MTPAEWARRNASAAAAKRMNNASGTDKLRLVLPFPPTVNHSSGPTSNGGRYLTPEHKAFRNEVSLRVIAAGSPGFGEARLAVEIHLTPPDRRRFDLDNRLKGTLDALQLCGVYEDDAQIDDLRVVRGDVIIPGEGSAVVTIHRRVA
jgi:crossover junction endodeoxyribonuclease RusA